MPKQDKAQWNGGGKWAQSSQDWMTSEEGREGERDGEEWWEGERETGSGRSWRRRRLEVKVGEQPVYPHAFHRILLQVVRIILQKNIIQSVRGSPRIFLCYQLFDGLFLRRITVGEQLHLSGIVKVMTFASGLGKLDNLSVRSHVDRILSCVCEFPKCENNHTHCAALSDHLCMPRSPLFMMRSAHTN